MNGENNAEVIFKENVAYNASLAKAKTKVRKHHPVKLRPDHVLPHGAVTAQELLGQLAATGITITERTLRNYSRRGWITPPYTINQGRGAGKMALYESAVVAEIQKIKTKGVLM